MGVPLYEATLDYPIPRQGYIPLDICTLPSMIESEIQYITNTYIDHGIAIATPIKSVTSTSSHHRHSYSELWVVG